VAANMMAADTNLTWARFRIVLCKGLSQPWLWLDAMLVITALIGTVEPVVLIFHWLLIFKTSPDVVTVIKSTWRPIGTLLWTGLLFMIIIMLFTVVAFLGFPQDYRVESGDSYTDFYCSSLFICFLTTFDQGFKNDGGIGGFLTDGRPPDELSRMLYRIIYDNLFNIVLMVLLLNIVFGVVLDTFAEMRTEEQTTEINIKTRCSVCHLEKSKFEEDHPGVGDQGHFDRHTHKEHNVVNYVHLVSYIRDKKSTEYTGLESYVAGLIEQAKPTFIPVNRAMSLENGTGETGASAETGAALETEAAHDDEMKMISGNTKVRKQVQHIDESMEEIMDKLVFIASRMEQMMEPDRQEISRRRSSLGESRNADR